MDKEKEKDIKAGLIIYLNKRLEFLQRNKKAIEDRNKDEYQSVLDEIDQVNIQLYALKESK